MAAEDLISYNGVMMRRDYAKSLETAQRDKFYRLGERIVPSIPFGMETYPMVTKGIGLCTCCATARGQLHEPLCEREQCPYCKLQMMSCDCTIFTYDAVEG